MYVNKKETGLKSELLYVLNTKNTKMAYLGCS